MRRAMNFMTKLILDGDNWILKLMGDVDTRVLKLLQFSEILEKLEKAEAKSLIIDLSEAEIIGSPGLRLLLKAKRELSRNDIEVILNNPSSHMRRLFRIMRFEQIFIIRENLVYC